MKNRNNNWKRCAVVGVIGTLWAIGSNIGARADDISHNPTPYYANEPSLYHANELSADLFGVAGIGHGSGKLGAGAGLSYFPLRYFGLGGDAYSQNTTGTFIDNASLSLIGRLPLGKSGLAPYIFGGGGNQFEAKQAFGQAGGGLEFRFAHHICIFADARYLWIHDLPNYGMGRFGFRFSF